MMSSSQKRWAGIDGCKGGWIVCEVGESSAGFSFVQHLSELNPELYETVLIDIPLAFAGNGHRSCEVEAKKRLKKRSSSLFFTPVKEAVMENDYIKGLEINRLKIGKGFSKQAFYLFPKIREAVAFKQKHSLKVFESHPELCFVGWAGSPPQFSKKTKEGEYERLLLIERLSPQLLAVLKEAPFQKSRDDMIDAAILALTAKENHRFTYLGDLKEGAIVYYEFTK